MKYKCRDIDTSHDETLWDKANSDVMVTFAQSETVSATLYPYVRSVTRLDAEYYSSKKFEEAVDEAIEAAKETESVSTDKDHEWEEWCDRELKDNLEIQFIEVDTG